MKHVVFSSMHVLTECTIYSGVYGRVCGEELNSKRINATKDFLGKVTHNWASIHNFCLWKTRNSITFSPQVKDLTVWNEGVDLLLSQARAEGTLKSFLEEEELKYIRIKLDKLRHHMDKSINTDNFFYWTSDSQGKISRKTL